MLSSHTFHALHGLVLEAPVLYKIYMVKIPFTFQFRDRQYSGMFEKLPPVGTEVTRFEVFDIDPGDYPVPDPFFIVGNYDDNDYSFPVGEGETLEFLRAIAKAVIAECDYNGKDRC